MLRVTSSVRIQTNVSSRILRLIGSVVGGMRSMSFVPLAPWREGFG
jgi:hypothetical protein